MRDGELSGGASDHPAAAPDASHADPHVHHVDVGSAPPVTPASTLRMVSIGVGAAALLAALFVAAFIPRRAVSKELAAAVASDSEVPIAEVAVVHRASSGGALELPGTIQALHEGAIYARVSGYVKDWRVDIGGLVHAGDVLADIDAPELVQQVEQAQHQVAQTRAALGLARADLDRWKLLAADSAVTREEYDQKQAAFDAATANTGAADANLQRLVDMQNFTRVTAPFAGVVTARNIDIGSLITAAGATSAPVGGSDVAGTQGAGSMFRIAETDTVRTFIPVPEANAPAMSVGLSARVDVQELPGRTFEGRIVRTSHALDVASRTLLTEVDIANPGFALMPGMYAEVTVQLQGTVPPIVIPASALVVRSAGPQVMVVDTSTPGHGATIHLRGVQVGRDYGSTIEILGGIPPGAVVIINPSAEMDEGVRVKIAAPSAPPASNHGGGT